jgi:arylsulfatase A-like enzyme
MTQPNQHDKVLPVLDVIALTLSAALIVILAENGVSLVNRLVLRRLLGTTTGFLWIVPLYYGLLFGALAAALALITRLLRRKIALQLVVTSSATLAAFSLLVIALYGKVYQWTLLIMALGLGIQAGRLAAQRAASTLRGARLLMIALAPLAVLPGLINPPLQRWLERREVAGLSPARAGAPNVLLIILDTVRAASLSLYGYERETTPNLERLAARGIVFTQVVSTTSWTLPSHASMFTGYYPDELGASWLIPLGDEHPTLAEAFRAAGYLTGGFVANLFYTHEESGLARGFTHYQDFLHRPGQLRRATALGQFFDTRDHSVRPFHPTSARKPAGIVSRQFLDWIDQSGDRPFFAFLNYFDAHRPYLAPENIQQRFSSGNRTRDRYDAAIASLDVEIGRLIDSLDQRDLLGNTLIIITSDHGELMGEHGLGEHGISLYMPSLRVPLLIMFGNRLPAGSRISRLVSLRDLAQTIARLASLDASFPGTSLSQLWQNDGIAEPHSPALSQIKKGIRSPPEKPVSRGDMTSLAHDSLHLIVNGDGILELYDFLQDPGEARDLSGRPDASEEMQMMRQRLQEAVSPSTRLAP